MPGKSDQFIHIPEYPGGTRAMNLFIRQNLRMPEDAVKQRIKGVVQLEVNIDHQGIVRDIQVMHSLGYGCDEEAIRVARLLRFLASYNRGIKVSRTLKLRFPFDASQIPEMTMSYSYVEKTDKQPQKPENTASGYGYTIHFEA